jgi:hypothetical protein
MQGRSSALRNSASLSNPAWMQGDVSSVEGVQADGRTWFNSQNSGNSQDSVTPIYFRALFSVKSNWALGCTARNRYSDGMQCSRECGVGQMA